jgi:GMP synthase-like glutamine amidotransferase
MKPIAIFRHTPTEGPGYCATFLSASSIPTQLIAIDAGNAVPDDPGLFSGLVFMGGPMSVNDDLPWIYQSLALIRQAVARDIPVMGHCLGGQLMAKALGGVVSRNPVKEIGWGDVTVLDNPAAHEWFSAAASTHFNAFHWHGETFSIPQGATRILESANCPNQAFVLGKHLGMQCHVEMTTEMVKNWCEVGTDEIAANPVPSVQTAKLMLENLEQHVAELNAVAAILYGRWIAGLAA